MIIIEKNLLIYITMNDYSLPGIASFLVFIAMLLYWFSLSIPKEKKFFQISKSLVLISNLLFVLTLGSRWIMSGYFPLSNLYESLIFLCWAISSIHLYIESKSNSRLIGALTTPLLFFISGFASLTLPTEMQKALPLVPSLQSNWLMMHVSMMMTSYATLIVGSLLSILYLFFEFFSKKEIGGETKRDEIVNFNYSSFSFSNNIGTSILQTIDVWSYRIIGLGFPFLTIGIISGAVWANEAWGSYWSWDPKETWALITWLVFAIYLHSRLLKGSQGTSAAILGSCGFFVIWICYLGVNFLGKGLHSYGWVL
jgi:cytochrome c-type biogenesis protein CcsB